MKIPVSAPNLTGNEEAYLLDALKSSWISSSGRYVNRFESEFASLIGTGHAASVANGTVALHLALVAFDLGPGDEVLMPALTYVATANAARYCGAKPVLVDVDPQTWCIDPGKIEAAITPKTKGIIAVHLYGHPADMDAINDIARRHKLWVIEDAAEAHFAKYKDRVVGGLSDIATFSFYGNKIITSGEGGALTYNGDDLNRKIRNLRSQGTDPDQRYFHPVVGYNYRLTNLSCALLCAQLERRDELVTQRQIVCDKYHQFLRDVPGFGFQPSANWATPSPWLFCVTIARAEYGMDRNALAVTLLERGIETRPFFYPLHFLPPYQEGHRPGEYPISENLSRIGLNLPTYVGLKNEEIEYVCAAIRDIHRTHAGSR